MRRLLSWDQTYLRELAEQARNGIPASRAPAQGNAGPPPAGARPVPQSAHFTSSEETAGTERA